MPPFNALGLMGSSGGGSAGRTAFGTVPNPIATPPNIFSQVNQSVPGFGNLTQGTSNVIGNELAGNVSPATLKAMQNAAATYGVTSGMPGSGLQQNGLFANIAGFSEGQQRKGLEDYLGTLSGVGHSMTDPGLAAEIASRNSTLAAAPDPQKAAERQLQEWLTKFGLTNGLGGSPGGGTGRFGGRPPDAPSFGGYGGGRDALGFPTTDMSGGAMGNSWYGAVPGVFGGSTEHIPAGAGGSVNPNLTTAAGNNPFLWSGNPRYGGTGYYSITPGIPPDQHPNGYFGDYYDPSVQPQGGDLGTGE